MTTKQVVGPGQEPHSLRPLFMRIEQGSALLDLTAAKPAGLGDDTGMAEEPARFAQPLQGENPFEAVKVS